MKDLEDRGAEFLEDNPWALKLILMFFAGIGVLMMRSGEFRMGLFITCFFGGILLLLQIQRLSRRRTKRFKAAAPYVRPPKRTMFKLLYWRRFLISSAVIFLGGLGLVAFEPEDLRDMIFKVICGIPIIYGVYLIFRTLVFPGHIRFLEHGVEIRKDGLTFRTDWDAMGAWVKVDEKWPKLYLTLKNPADVAGTAITDGGERGYQAFQKKYGAGIVSIELDAREYGLNPAYLESLIDLYKKDRSLRRTLGA